MKWHHAIRFAALLAALVLSSCASLDFDNLVGSDDGDDDGGRTQSSGSVTGSYQWVESQWGEGAPGGPPSSTDQPDSLHRETLDLNAEGDYLKRAYNDAGQTLFTESGTWRVQNGSLILTSGEFSNSWDYTLSDGRLTLTRAAGDGDFLYWQRVVYQK